MPAYRSKHEKLPGTSYDEIGHKARQLYQTERRRIKRNPYIRSAYFNKDKVFLEYFWHHLASKRKRDRKRRLRYYGAALDLIKYTTLKPITKHNPNNKSQVVHRFTGVTADKQVYYVQVVEDKKTNKKYFISVFPDN